MFRLQLVGRIGSDAVVKDINGRKVINFSVAYSEKYTDKDGVLCEKTQWVNCGKWVDSGGSVELAKYLLKGTQIFVEGKPNVRTYTTNEHKTAIDFGLSVAFVKLLVSPKAAENKDTATVSKTETVEKTGEFNDDLPF